MFSPSKHKATFFWDDIQSFKKDYKSALYAIKAVGEGRADEIQQKRAMSFIIKNLCRADETNYFPDERDTCFALGREAVGKLLRGIILDSDYTNGDKQ